MSDTNSEELEQVNEELSDTVSAQARKVRQDQQRQHDAKYSFGGYDDLSDEEDDYDQYFNRKVRTALSSLFFPSTATYTHINLFPSLSPHSSLYLSLPLPFFLFTSIRRSHHIPLTTVVRMLIIETILLITVEALGGTHAGTDSNTPEEGLQVVVGPTNNSGSRATVSTPAGGIAMAITTLTATEATAEEAVVVTSRVIVMTIYLTITLH